MALQSLLCRLPRKCLLGSSSNGVGKVNISDSAIWTSPWKSPVLLPWRMPHIEDFKNLHSFAPMNYSLQPGNHSQRYQRGGARDLPLGTDNSQRSHLHGGAGTPPLEPYKTLNLYGDELLRVMVRAAAKHIRGCLVCLAFSHDGEILAELPGTIIRSDGIIATSASGLSSLKSKELKVTVDVRIPDTGETCNVAAGRSFPHRGWALEELRYVACYRSIPFKETSGQIIEAAVRNSEAADIGACLVDSRRGVVGIVHYVHDSEVKATPIDIVFKTLEDIEIRRATPESDFLGVEATV